MSKVISCNYTFPFEKFASYGAIVGHNETVTLLTDLKSDEKSGNSVEICSFFGKESKKVWAHQVLTLSLKEFRQIIDEFVIPELPEVLDSTNWDQEFIQSIESYKRSDTHQIRKFVPCTREELKHKGQISPLSFLKKVAAKETTGYLYGMWHQGEGIIGLTPEPSLIREGEHYSTYSIAATSRTPEELSSEKMVDEQEIVTADILSGLNEFETENLATNDHLLQANGLVHRQTEIEFIAESELFRPILNSLTPTGALGVLPKERLDYLKQHVYYRLEGDKRTFGGNFIFSTNHSNIALVMIRSIQWKDDRSWIDTGCGVTSLSDPNEELHEAHIKRETIKKLFYE